MPLWLSGRVMKKIKTLQNYPQQNVDDGTTFLRIPNYRIKNYRMIDFRMIDVRKLELRHKFETKYVRHVISSKRYFFKVYFYQNNNFSNLKMSNISIDYCP
jgi:hypothetical protein